MSLPSLLLANDFEGAESLLAHDPDCAGDVGIHNLFSQKALSYPLHYLCRRQATPASTMRAMIKASPPKAFVYRDSASKSTPLHLAIWYKLSVESILLLLESSKEALVMQDMDGNLPIHLASALHPEANRLITAFLAIRPDTALRRNAKAQTPLHSLCTRSDVDVDTLSLVIKAAPNASGWKDRMGRLPIHHACLHQASLPVLECLLRAFPRGVNSFDHSGLNPYGIVRRRWKWESTDARVRLLRKDMIQSSRFPVAVRNQIQFKLEDLSSKTRAPAVLCPMVAQ